MDVDGFCAGFLRHVDGREPCSKAAGVPAWVWSDPHSGGHTVLADLLNEVPVLPPDDQNDFLLDERPP